MAGPSLGLNLGGVVDWSTGFPFIDLFQMSRAWYTPGQGQFDTGDAALLDLDANGWVRGFTHDGSPAPFDRAETILLTNGSAVRTGTYVLDWAGEGTVDLGLIPASAIIARGDHKITFRITGPDPLTVQIAQTDPNRTGDYIRDIRLYHTDDAALLQEGQMFTPEFLEKMQDFRVLRFMDWMETNNSTVDGPEDLRPGDYARETGGDAEHHGVSVETMVALANQVRTDPWFNIPHLASDANGQVLVDRDGGNALSGGQLADALFGLRGDDVLTARGGKDVLVGDLGRDTLYGGADEDLLRGGAGNDDLGGGSGQDRLIGGTANDTLQGDPGRTRCKATWAMRC